MQTKPKCVHEHDIMELNAGPPREKPQNFECLFLYANKATATLVTSATRGCSTSLKNKRTSSYISNHEPMSIKVERHYIVEGDTF